MDVSILEGFGLTRGEIKTYLALLELGKTKVGQVIEKSGLTSSAVHNSVHSLTRKGLVSFVKEGKIKFYKSATPEQLIEFIKEKQKKLEAILPELESRQFITKENQEAQVFQGTKGVTTMLNTLIYNTKKGDEYLFFAVDVDEQNKEIQEFFTQYDAKRKDKGLIIKGLCSNRLKDLFANRKLLKMKYLNGPLPAGISICTDKIALYSWEEKPVGYLIQSKQISEMYKHYFNNLWEAS